VGPLTTSLAEVQQVKLATVGVFFLLVVSGCGTIPPLSDAAVEDNYQAGQKPPSAEVRIYVLPPLDRTSLGNFEVEGRVMAGYASAQTTVVGWVSKTRFVAFDAKPGVLYLKWGPAVNYKDQAQYFQTSRGQTLAVRPVAANNGAMFGLVGAAVAAMANDGTPAFEFVEPDELARFLNGKHLSSMTPEAAALFQQK
jgi:hypothetical protein